MVQYAQVESGGDIHYGERAARVAGAGREYVYDVDGAHLGSSLTQLFHRQSWPALFSVRVHS